MPNIWYVNSLEFPENETEERILVTLLTHWFFLFHAHRRYGPIHVSYSLTIDNKENFNLGLEKI